MSISCGCDTDGCDWFYYGADDFSKLNTKRSRKCCNCGTRIEVGGECIKLSRAKYPESDIEERIYGDEVPLSAWYMCEECGGVYLSITEAGYCVTLDGDDIRKAMKEIEQ